jgi:hypothetical protein
MTMRLFFGVLVCGMFVFAIACSDGLRTLVRLIEAEKLLRKWGGERRIRCPGIRAH